LLSREFVLAKGVHCSF